MQGADWFESQLLDYDVCSNWGNWVAAAGMTGGHRPTPDLASVPLPDEENLVTMPLPTSISQAEGSIL